MLTVVARLSKQQMCSMPDIEIIKLLQMELFDSIQAQLTGTMTTPAASCGTR